MTESTRAESRGPQTALTMTLTIHSYRCDQGSFFGATKCWTYKVWDTRGFLAYVGIADEFTTRWRQHQRTSWWLGEIEVDQIIVTGWLTREDARQEEAAVINLGEPTYNTAREEKAFQRYQSRELKALPVEEFVLVPIVDVDVAGERIVGDRFADLLRGL